MITTIVSRTLHCLKETVIFTGPLRMGKFVFECQFLFTLHNYIRLKDPNSSRSLQVFTNQPCVQLYVGGYLDGETLGKDNLPMQQHAGLCLETQYHPNAANEVRTSKIK